jgi:hypothetical protein
MKPLPPARPVKTPGSYHGVTPSKKRRVTPNTTPKVGRPVKKKKGRKDEKRRELYTEVDMQEAIRLVREDEFSIAKASKFLNSVKVNPVPRMTLSDRVKRPNPGPVPLGRPQELSRAAEEAIVDCVELCGEFQYPLNKAKLQDLIQDYCEENSVTTRWTDSRPGREWIKSFKKRYAHRIKVKKPSNIKRSRAKVGPEDVRKFFDR